MAQSSLHSDTSEYYHDSVRFVNRCTEKFQWKKLSKAVVMDIGCGNELNCCKAILEHFPNVKAIIAVDKESSVFQTTHFKDGKIQFSTGDILKWDSLKSHEGKMDKIISTNTFDEIIDKETAFRNVYRLLKPGGEAGFYFCMDSDTHKLLSVLSEIPKYRAFIEDTYPKNLYSSEYYRELLEKIGFKNVRAFDQVKRLPFLSDECFKDFLIEKLKIYLKLSPEATEAFKAEVLELYEEKFGRTEEIFYYVSVQLNLFGVK